jgi:lipoprotein-anchoring transpeptidase ErfK/SrfK
MRKRPLLLVLGLLVVLALGATGATYAYDRGRETRLAEGVSVGGIPVGGMEVAAARAKVRAALVEPLDRPVRVRHGDERFRLTPRQARVAVDAEATVSRALQRSRAGNLFARAWRDVRGKPLAASLPVQVDFDRRAVSRLVRRVERRLERPAKDAELDLTQGQVAPTDSSEGRRVRTTLLRREITRTLLATGERETVRVRTGVVEPKVTRKDLAERYPAILVVNRSSFSLTLYQGLERVRDYPIAVGQAGLETPAGLYNIQNKAIDPAWHVPNSDWAGDLAGKVIPGDDPSNPIKARWMGIYAGAGIHGTDAEDSLGTAASHGCIRMRIADVKELYEDVPVGAPVYIA